MGPALTETLFDAGLRRATVQRFQAAHDQAVANYRETALAAFRQVEDGLASLRILSQDIEQQGAAVRSAERNLEEAMTRYHAGLDPYLNVLAAQTLLLENRQAATTFRIEQIVATVRLVEALGGGWDASRIPPAHPLAAESSSTLGPDTAAAEGAAKR